MFYVIWIWLRLEHCKALVADCSRGRRAYLFLRKGRLISKDWWECCRLFFYTGRDIERERERVLAVVSHACCFRCVIGVRQGRSAFHQVDPGRVETAMYDLGVGRASADVIARAM